MFKPKDHVLALARDDIGLKHSKAWDDFHVMSTDLFLIQSNYLSIAEITKFVCAIGTSAPQRQCRPKIVKPKYLDSKLKCDITSNKLVSVIN